MNFFRGSRTVKVHCILKGTKFMQLTLTYGNGKRTIFRDTRLHLVGSLDKLGSEFFPDRNELRKGHFPHGFNKEENYDYSGQIPDKKYFNLDFSIQDDRALADFNSWYTSQAGVLWVFKEELVKYCIQDVIILANIIKAHHDTCLDVVSGNGERPFMCISPWYFTTAASYVHQLFNTFNTWVSGLREKVADEVADERTIKAADENWCQLMFNEHNFAKSGLRGGRCEIFKHHHNGLLKYIDITSEYPFIQTAKSLEVCGESVPLLFPVGSPEIEIWDGDFYPCCLHAHLHSADICPCSYDQKKARVGFPYTKLKIKEIDHNVDITDYINGFGTDYVGIIMADITPPTNLLRPVLPTLTVSDNGYRKCEFSLLPIVKGVYATPELQLAIKKGYVVTKIFRCDRYKAAPSKWAELMKDLYKLKLYNSQSCPNGDERDFIATQYLERFDMSLDFMDHNWCKNPAKKASAKALINSAWGKHAESLDHDLAEVMGPDQDQQNHEFLDNVQKDNYTVKGVHFTNQFTLYTYEQNRKNGILPKLDKTYIPAAVFVPMYGRMMLYNILDKVGINAIMCDTDSIIYDPVGLDVIPTGKVLGDWEEEVEEDKGDIIEFIALASKSYGLRYRDRSTVFKSKGLCLKRSHRNCLNFDTAKALVLTGGEILVPQYTFKYSLCKGIWTCFYLKKTMFDPANLKGVYDSETTLVFPKGFIR